MSPYCYSCAIVYVSVYAHGFVSLVRRKFIAYWPDIYDQTSPSRLCADKMPISVHDHTRAQRADVVILWPRDYILFKRIMTWFEGIC